MRHTGLKWSAITLCSMSIILMSASVSDAGIIPWIWNGIFGHHDRCAPACPPSYAPACPTSCPPCGPCGTSPCGPGGCNIQSSYYVPSGCSSCGTALCGVSCCPTDCCSTGCCPTGGCATGNCGIGGCPSGNCSIPQPATSNRTPEPSTERKTYSEDSNSSDPEAGWDKTQEGAPLPEDEPPADVDAFKGKGAVETPGINEEGATPPDAAPEAAPEADPASTEGEAQLGPRLFRELHNTVGWKPVVSSKRLTRRPTYAKAEIHRRSREAKGEWKVVPSTSNIAKR